MESMACAESQELMSVTDCREAATGCRRLPRTDSFEGSLIERCGWLWEVLPVWGDVGSFGRGLCYVDGLGGVRRSRIGSSTGDVGPGDLWNVSRTATGCLIVCASFKPLFLSHGGKAFESSRLTEAPNCRTTSWGDCSTAKGATLWPGLLAGTETSAKLPRSWLGC